MLRLCKVKEMLRNRRVCVMLSLGKGMVKIVLSKFCVKQNFHTCKDRLSFGKPNSLNINLT